MCSVLTNTPLSDRPNYKFGESGLLENEPITVPAEQAHTTLRQ